MRIKFISADIYLKSEELVEENGEDKIPTGRYELELADTSFVYWDSPDVIEGKQTFLPSFLCMQ
jgi:hypothetical protein